MAFERSPHDKEHPYTRISNHILNDTYLDVKDKGLMACILSLPEDWKFSESGLSKRFGMNRTTLRKSLKRLEEAGYLKRIQQARNSKGKFVAADWTVIECPTRVQNLYSSCTDSIQSVDNYPLSVFYTEQSKYKQREGFEEGSCLMNDTGGNQQCKTSLVDKERVWKESNEICIYCLDPSMQGSVKLVTDGERYKCRSCGKEYNSIEEAYSSW